MDGSSWMEAVAVEYSNQPGGIVIVNEEWEEEEDNNNMV